MCKLSSDGDERLVACIQMLWVLQPKGFDSQRELKMSAQRNNLETGAQKMTWASFSTGFAAELALRPQLSGGSQCWRHCTLQQIDHFGIKCKRISKISPHVSRKDSVPFAANTQQLPQFIFGFHSHSATWQVCTELWEINLHTASRNHAATCTWELRRQTHPPGDHVYF